MRPTFMMFLALTTGAPAWGTSLGELGATTATQHAIAGTSAPSAARTIGSVRAHLARPTTASKGWKQSGHDGWQHSGRQGSTGSSSSAWAHSGTGRR